MQRAGQRALKTWTFAASVLGGALLIAWLTVNKLAVLSITQVIEVQERPLPAASGAAAVARGEHLVRAVLGCPDCHAPDLGGRQLLDDPGRARIASADITAPRRSAAELTRAVRHGVRGDERGLWLMPNDAYRALADDDLAAVIAYLATVPPVGRKLPPNRLYLGGRIAVALSRWRLVTAEAAVVAPAHVAVEGGSGYGAYLFRIGRCAGCHAPDALPRRAAAAHPAALRALLTAGRGSDGQQVPAHLPLADGYRRLDGTELAALVSFLAGPP